MKIKNIVSKTLIEERENKLTSSLRPLKDIKEPSLFIESYFKITKNLMNEGYSINEIGDFFNGASGNFDWGKMGKDAALSMAKEYFINMIVSGLGANKNFSRFIAQSFADTNPLDILKPFKDMDNCMAHFNQFADGIMEAIIRYIGASITDVDKNGYVDTDSLTKTGQNLANNFIGNAVGQAIRESNLGEFITDKFCKLIH